MTIADPVVLLVDDLVETAEMMRIVFKRAGFVKPLLITSDGEQAIAYLRGDSGSDNYKQSGMPTVILLDLYMPRKNGFEVLSWIRNEAPLKSLPVCILTGSSLPSDIARAYALGASAYLVKPDDLTGLMHLASSLLTWLRLIHLPAADHPVPSQ